MPLPEKALIAELRRMAESSRKAGARGRSAVRTGIGDDCAVLGSVAGRDFLVTTDFSLEGIHFRRDWHSADSIGHRCLTRGLSDIAAMGGEPMAAFLSLAVPPEVPQSWVRGFARGLLRLADRYGVSLAGGDTAESPKGILADIMVVGSVPAGRAALRSGARPGDRIYVSGELGGSAAAIKQMRSAKKKVSPRQYPHHFFPEPRIELGRFLREKSQVSAMIDTSDGLSTDLAHICEESGVGAEIEAALIPRARIEGFPGLAKSTRPGASEVNLDLALHGGEDYELLFTVPKAKRAPRQIAGVRLTEIGVITRARKILLRKDGRPSELRPAGWEHFRG